MLTVFDFVCCLLWCLCTLAHLQYPLAHLQYPLFPAHATFQDLNWKVLALGKEVVGGGPGDDLAKLWSVSQVPKKEKVHGGAVPFPLLTDPSSGVPFTDMQPVSDCPGGRGRVTVSRSNLDKVG